ncbi:hypothetical protein [Schnuerera ultunensis]|uniref:Uncharacterized protein n=1 Tax=[Clostridium] ultunense Esp TaxID=1288971 RepID=A0A1M4PPV7_9FIRM|nr:hypothetical protein [Schnuerera ultunensis]SHD77514.1 protein of unknown function [[Clostridium] ultunense Esp]
MEGKGIYDNKIKTVTYEEAIKDMTEEELGRFHKERYRKLIKPLMEMNERELRKMEDKK